MNKLGKLKPNPQEKHLHFHNYINCQTLPVPTVCSQSAKMTNIGMMLNDNIGDCTCASAGHLIQLWTSEEGKQIIPSDDQILKAYKDVSGYNPTTGENDNGALLTDVLRYWNTTGVADHKIDTYAALEPVNIDHVKIGIYYFNGIYLGVDLPLTVRDMEDTWSVVPQYQNNPDARPGTWGGHAICAVGYDDFGISFISWGKVMKMSWNFWKIYCDEAYVVISQDYLTENKTPENIDVQQLKLDMQKIQK